MARRTWLSPLRLPLVPLLAAVTAAVAMPAAGATAPLAAAALRTVHYDGVSVQVPSAWPVYDVRSDPTRCERLDVHAVYLGAPGPRERCPAHLVGRTEAVVIAPGAGDGDNGQGQFSRRVNGGAAHVMVSFGADSGLARGIAESVASSGASTPAMRPAAYITTAPALAAQATSSRSVFIGNGFDACDAPTTATMQTWWTSSPYRAANIYIGGVSRGCANQNLTAQWVATVRGIGWRLIPTYVDLQAPCSSFTQKISTNTSTATQQGVTAADGAIARAASLGLPTNAPLYDDIENYDRTNHSCSAAVLAFASGWTQELHARGYQSGLYGSGGSLDTDLVAQLGTGYLEPDDLWIGDWNGLDSIYGDPYVPDGFWARHQRIHQWHGGRTETYGGVAINIDGDATDGAVVGPPGGSCVGYPVDTFGPDGCSGGVSFQGPLQFWRLGSPNGLVGSTRWTMGSGSTEENGATWAPALAPGSYDVAAYIPPADATATVHYTVADASGSHVVTVAQGSHRGSWVRLGRFATAPGGTVSVHIGDDTATSSVVGVDAMRFVRVPDPWGDFNGDGRTDVAVFRPSTATWWIRDVTKVQYGRSGDVPLVGDFNGDGRSDIAVFRPSTGTWWVRGLAQIRWGQNGDIPVVGDYNGDGRPDLAVFRPSTATWWIRGVAKVQYGRKGDIPVVGDFNGDGRSDIAVFRPSTGTWWIHGVTKIRWGQNGDVPVVGDLNGDGRSDLAVFRPSTGTWWIRGIAKIAWGRSGDVPLVGEFNGDGHLDLAVFRPSTGTWWIRAVEKVRWGQSGDIPR